MASNFSTDSKNVFQWRLIDQFLRNGASLKALPHHQRHHLITSSPTSPTNQATNEYTYISTEPHQSYDHVIYYNIPKETSNGNIHTPLPQALIYDNIPKETSNGDY